MTLAVMSVVHFHLIYSTWLPYRKQVL